MDNGASVMSGSINGVKYTAASTVGDGACGLHALFGVPQKQELRADNVRTRVLEALPSDLASLRGDLCEEVRDYLNSMLDSIWEEAKAAASNRVQMQEPRSESSLALCFLWIGRFSALWKPDAEKNKKTRAALRIQADLGRRAGFRTGGFAGSGRDAAPRAETGERCHGWTHACRLEALSTRE